LVASFARVPKQQLPRSFIAAAFAPQGRSSPVTRDCPVGIDFEPSAEAVQAHLVVGSQEKQATEAG
jgi:hypothetical protein